MSVFLSAFAYVLGYHCMDALVGNSREGSGEWCKPWRLLVMEAGKKARFPL